MNRERATQNTNSEAGLEKVVAEPIETSQIASSNVALDNVVAKPAKASQISESK